MVAVATLDRLSPAEVGLVDQLLAQLVWVQQANSEAERYYDASLRWENLGIAVPAEMEPWLDSTLGWCGIAVDTLEERLDWTGWVTDRDDDFGLMDAFNSNQLALESSLLNLDCLIYGTAFWSVTTGSDGEPDPLVMAESPKNTTYVWSRRARRATAAIVVGERDATSLPSSVSLHLPGQTVVLRSSVMVEPERWVVEDRITYPHDRVPIVPVVNRPWGTRRQGRSEITRAMRYLQKNAVRTLAGWEIAREFFAAPQRWAMGASEKSFVDADGKPLTAWQAYTGRVWSMERDENGDVPSVGQFPSSDPSPYFAGLRGLGSMFAAEAGLAVSYLGLPTDQPASADAIRAGDARLLKRSERRQVQIGAANHQVGEQVYMLTHNTDAPPPEFAAVDESWRDPATPTRAASSDAATKLVAAGILPAESEVTMDLVGLSKSDQRRVQADRRRYGGGQILEALLKAPTTAADQSTADGLMSTTR